MSQITIKNISTATVVISIPDSHFRRELSPGRVIPLTKQQYDDFMFDTGFSALVRGHYIAIYGVEDHAVVEEVTNVIDKDAINKMLDELDITTFSKFIPTAAPAEKETVIQLAVDKGITHSAFTALIKKYCGVDIIRAINVKHELEEEK